jgi:hypothetical protein
LGVSFARRAVWIRYRLQDLAPTGNGNFYLIGIASDRADRLVEIEAFPGHWEGRVVVTEPHGQVVACAVTHRIDYDRNRVSLRVPRSCLGRAGWVRVGVRTTVAGATYAYVDDARAAGCSPTLTYGRPVHRWTREPARTSRPILRSGTYPAAAAVTRTAPYREVP